MDNKKIFEFLKNKFDKRDSFDLNQIRDKTNSVIGVHPEIQEVLWEDFGVGIPNSSKMVLSGLPILICGNSSTIIGIGLGMNPPLIRFSPVDYEEALGLGCEMFLENLDGIYADKVGEHWLYSWSFIDEVPRFVKRAYDYYNAANI